MEQSSQRSTFPPGPMAYAQNGRRRQREAIRQPNSHLTQDRKHAIHDVAPSN
jgi:hypothetical protein